MNPLPKSLGMRQWSCDSLSMSWTFRMSTSEDFGIHFVGRVCRQVFRASVKTYHCPSMTKQFIESISKMWLSLSSEKQCHVKLSTLAPYVGRWETQMWPRPDQPRAEEPRLLALPTIPLLLARLLVRGALGRCGAAVGKGE